MTHLKFRAIIAALNTTLFKVGPSKTPAVLKWKKPTLNDAISETIILITRANSIACDVERFKSYRKLFLTRYSRRNNNTATTIIAVSELK